jgi:hypothetical protein
MMAKVNSVGGKYVAITGSDRHGDVVVFAEIRDSSVTFSTSHCGYHFTVHDVTSDQCRVFAEWLTAAADELDGRQDAK